jgi:hypothetical protein
MVISDVILDGLVLLIPWYPVWKLMMPVRQKVLVSGIFLLGGFVCLSGIFRVIAMFDAMNFNPDRTYVRAPAFYWATIETGIGIVSACLPTLRPLFSKSGPESIVMSAQRKLRGVLSRSKLVSEDRTDYSLQHRPSEASEASASHLYDHSATEKQQHIYDGPTSKFQQQIKIEAAEHEHQMGHPDGIKVESSVSQNAKTHH